MNRRFLSFLIVCLTSISFADSAIQTDWSGGPGVQGPVTSLGTAFNADTPAIDYAIQGQLMLAEGIIENTVNSSLGGASSICTGDFDLDGDLDIAGVGYAEDYVSWWENINGLGTCWIEHTVCWECSSGVDIASGDLDGDGDLDLIATSYGLDTVIWFENDALRTTWTEHIIDAYFDGAYSVCTADIDGDEDQDVIGSCIGGDLVVWWDNTDGSGMNWLRRTIDTAVDLPSSITAEDLDNDGDKDIAGLASLDGQVCWWENENGIGTNWIEHIVDPNANLPWEIWCADIDSDGSTDIVVAALSDAISWWRNVDGTGTLWTQYVIDTGSDNVTSVCIADIDDDGDQDVVTATAISNKISWYENLDGAGTEWSEVLISDSMDNPGSVFCADLDGNSCQDIIASEYWFPEIKWWNLNLLEIDGSLESTIYDTQTEPDWEYIEWDSETPSGTSVCFQVRASDDFENMGDWSDTLTMASSLSGVLNDGDRYVQYRTILETSDPDETPILQEIILTWNQMCAEGGTEPEAHVLLPFTPNPALHPAVRFGLVEPVETEIAIFDLSGRIVTLILSSQLPAGYHSILIDDLSSGIYFCLMTAGEFTAIQRFVVIK